MENLASEKMILELTLANEKRDAVCEKENLGDQLRNALEGLYKAQSAQEVSHFTSVFVLLCFHSFFLPLVVSSARIYARFILFFSSTILFFIIFGIFFLSFHS